MPALDFIVAIAVGLTQPHYDPLTEYISLLTHVTQEQLAGRGAAAGADADCGGKDLAPRPLAGA